MEAVEVIKATEFTFNHYRLPKYNKISLVVTLTSSVDDISNFCEYERMMDHLSKYLSKTKDRLITIMTCTDNSMKLFIIPTYNGNWIPLMLRLKADISAFLAIAPGKKSVKLSNDYFRDMSNSLIDSLWAIIDAEKKHIAVYNDDALVDIFKHKFNIDVFNKNPEEDDLELGIALSWPHEIN